MRTCEECSFEEGLLGDSQEEKKESNFARIEHIADEDDRIKWVQRLEVVFEDVLVFLEDVHYEQQNNEQPQVCHTEHESKV